jgi:hypothetical protein
MRLSALHRPRTAADLRGRDRAVMSEHRALSRAWPDRSAPSRCNGDAGSTALTHIAQADRSTRARSVLTGSSLAAPGATGGEPPRKLQG